MESSGVVVTVGAEMAANKYKCCAYCGSVIDIVWGVMRIAG